MSNFRICLLLKKLLSNIKTINMNLESLKYPVGKWSKPDNYSEAKLKSWVEDIRSFPAELSKLLMQANEDTYSKRYRPEGWTLRQLVHHVVDSHMNGYIRQKLAYTESNPTISPYLEAAWADLDDVKTVSPMASLRMLQALHLRWSVFLDSLDSEALERSYFHPEHNRAISIKESIHMYAWHSRHHLAHVKLVLTNPY